MFIETRLHIHGTVFLVNEIGNEDKGACCWMDCSQDGFKEYGCGSKMFLFEAMGGAYQPFAFDLIHANSKSEAEDMVQKRYKERFERKTLFRSHKELKDVIDER